jgi:hypothetical protein
MDAKAKKIFITFLCTIGLILLFFTSYVASSGLAARHDERRELAETLSNYQRAEAELRRAEERITELAELYAGAKQTNIDLRAVVKNIGGTVRSIENSAWIFADTNDRYGFLIGQLEQIIRETPEGIHPP